VKRKVKGKREQAEEAKVVVTVEREREVSLLCGENVSCPLQLPKKILHFL